MSSIIQILALYATLSNVAPAKYCDPYIEYLSKTLATQIEAFESTHVPTDTGLSKVEDYCNVEGTEQECKLYWMACANVLHE